MCRPFKQNHFRSSALDALGGDTGSPRQVFLKIDDHQDRL